MALQQPRRQYGLMVDPDMADETSSLCMVGEAGLVQLHRAKYSPRPPAPGVTDSSELDA